MPAQPSRLKTVQLVVSSLIGGMVLMPVVAVLFTRNAPTEPTRPAPGDAQEQVLPESSLTVPFAVATGLLALGAFIAPILVISPMHRRAAERWKHEGQAGEQSRDAVLAQFQAYAIARAAAPGALGLGCAIAALVTGELLFLAGVGLALVLIAAVFPSRSRQEDFYRRVTGGPPPAET